LEIKKSNTAIICLSSYSGGMEIDTIKLAKKLSKSVDITLIAKKNCFIASYKEDFLGFNGIKLETISFKSSLSLSIIFKVREIVKKHNIKNVIFFGASEIKSLYFSFFNLDINLIIRHGTTKSRPKKDFFHRLIYSSVNYHVSICKHLQKNVEFIIPFGKKSKSKLIYSSIEIAEKEKINHEKLALVHVGRIADAKGQVDAIKACDILYKNGIDFIFYIVGGFDESYKKEFMSFYNSIEYKENIKLVGYIKNVDEYLRKSDIFIFPSLGEGLGNAFIEALSSDLICISYDNTSFPEFVELGFDFFMVENKNEENLKNTLLDVVKNLTQYNKQVLNNFALSKKLFRKDREISEYLEILI
jgi:glycosyltransferase involved in cell wall biosynthesis